MQQFASLHEVSRTRRVPKANGNAMASARHTGSLPFSVRAPLVILRLVSCNCCFRTWSYMVYKQQSTKATACETVNEKVVVKALGQEHDEGLYSNWLMRSTKLYAPDRACANDPALDTEAL
eukprot:21408-Heterococcus_DN1.PRE.1